MRLITASDLMNPAVMTVRDDLTVDELASYLVDNEITGAPVVDRRGRLVGVVSLVDIAEVASGSPRLGSARPGFFQRGQEGKLSDSELKRLAVAHELRVRDIMTPEIFSVSEDATVSDVASRMLREHLHRLLVVRGNEVVGIVSTSDLLGLLVDVE